MKRGATALGLFGATLTLAGCIPPGGSDYRIGSATSDAETAVEKPVEPVIKPEREPIAGTPSWSPASVERNGQLVEASTYIVQPGDSLYRIESATGAGLSQIVEANDLTAPYAIRAGQKLTIPAGFYHRVGRGETGIAIARAYGVSWADIVELNRLQYPYVLREGQRLRLPDAASAVLRGDEPSSDEMASAFTLDIDSIVTGGEPALPSKPVGTGQLPVPVTNTASFGGSFAWPLSGSLLAKFGNMGGGRINDGIDIGAGAGTAVRASAAGVVAYSGNEIGVYGGLVLLDHGSGWVTAYGHMGRLDVVRGDRVKAGQVIGAVGETGYVDRPQLHFEIRKDRQPIDPVLKLPAR